MSEAINQGDVSFEINEIGVGTISKPNYLILGCNYTLFNNTH